MAHRDKSKDPPADILLHNGTLITMDPLKPQAEALAIQGERIVWVGENKDSSAWIGPNTKVIDLKGACATPGFIDTHAHIVYTGLAKKYLQLSGCQDKEEVLELVKKQVKKSREGEWILGFGWSEGRWLNKAHPTASDLDQVAPHNPVVLRRADSHAIWVNSCVLKLAGIDASTPDNEGGKIVRDSQGIPTGILVDSAMTLVKNLMPQPDLEETIQLAKAVLDESLSLGITMIHNAATETTEFEAYKQLAAQNALPLRIYAMMVIRDPTASSLPLQSPQNFGSFLDVRCLKFFVDGAFGSRGAALFPEQ